LFDSLDNASYKRFHLYLLLITGAGAFTDSFNQFAITGASLSLVSFFRTINASTVSLSLFFVGSFVGAILWGGLADLIGRRFTFILDLIVLAVFGFSSALIANLPELYITRFIIGLAAGGDYPVAVALLTEFSPKSSRGRLLSIMWSVFFAAGLVALLLAYLLYTSLGSGPVQWRILLALGGAPAILGLIFRLRVPESPRWLANRGRLQETISSLEKVSEVSPKLKEFSTLNSRTGKVMSTLFSKRYVQVTMALTCVAFLPTLTGAFLGTESPYLFEALGFIGKYSLLGSALLLYLPWLAVGIILSVCDVIDRLGRIPVILAGLFGMGALDLALGGALRLGSISFVLLTYTGVSVCIAIWFTVQMGWGAEMYPTQIRGTGEGYNVFCNRAGAAFSVLLGPYLLGLIGGSATFMIYGVLAFVAGGVGYALLRSRGKVERKSLEEASGEVGSFI
jgi:MFS family permease